jgi:hypothetical protein
MEDLRQMANEMLQAKVIDRRTYIQLREPPMSEMLEARLKKIEEGEKQAGEQKQMLEVAKIAAKIKR